MKRVNQVAITVGALFVFAMMVLIGANIVGRKLGLPVVGAISMAGFMVVVFTFLSLAACEEADRHVRMDILLSRFSPRLRSITLVFSYVVALAVFLIMLWGSGMNALASWQIMEVDMTDIELPVYPAKTVLTIGVGLMCIQLAAGLVRMIKRHRAGVPPDDRREMGV